MSVLDGIGRRPRLAALVGALSIAFSGIFFRFSGTSPSTATVFRCLYALPWLLPLLYVERRRFGPLPGRELRLGIVAGVFFAFDLLTWHHSVELVGAGLATVMGNLQVVVVAIAAWLLFGERPQRPTLVALPFMLMGVVLLSGVVGSGAYGSNPSLGVAFGTATAFFYAGYLIVMRHGIRDARRPATGLFLSTASTAIVGVLVGVLVGDFDPMPVFPAHWWLIAVGLTSQAIGYMLISLSLPRLPAVLTSLILLAQPITTMVFGALLLGEDPSVFQLGGVGLIVAGLVVANLRLPVSDRRRTSGSNQVLGASLETSAIELDGAPVWSDGGREPESA